MLSAAVASLESRDFPINRAHLLASRELNASLLLRKYGRPAMVAALKYANAADKRPRTGRVWKWSWWEEYIEEDPALQQQQAAATERAKRAADEAAQETARGVVRREWAKGGRRDGAAPSRYRRCRPVRASSPPSYTPMPPDCAASWPQQIAIHPDKTA